MTETARYVRSAGILVCVRFDQEGQPRYATPVDRVRPDDPEHERLVELAVKQALDAAVSKWKSKKRKRNSANAAVESAQARAKASAEHWTNEWFERAHAIKPRYGKDRLTQLARSLAAAADDKAKRPEDKIPAEMRDEITVERARAYLERVRNAPQQ